MALLAYRAVIISGVSNLLSNYSCDQDLRKFFAPEDPLSKITYLEQHDADRPVGDMLKRALTAIYLECCLEFSPSFPALSQEDKDKVTAVLLTFLQSFSCNAYEVAETVVKRGDVKDAESVQLGGAVHPLVSMTNHSCSPNVMRVSYGTVCVVKAVKPIKAGEELLDNYGYFFHSMGAAERQERYSSLP
jgi:hypothetical protein